MGVKSTVFLEAVSYLKISFIGVVFLFVYLVFQSLMRGIGNVKTPMYIVLVSVLLNLVLDPLFIFGYGFIPALGVEGAALSSLGTQFLAAAFGIFLLIRGKGGIKISLKNLKLDKLLIKKMFRLGFPASIEQSSRALGLVLMTVLVSSYGTLALASYGIGVRILSFIIIPALGLSMATSTLVGQNMGANKINRAERAAYLSSLVAFFSLSIVGLLIFIFAQQISTIFIPGDLATIKMSALFIKIMSLSFGFIGIQLSLNGVFRGSGNTLISMAISLISLWFLRLPLAYLLSKYIYLSELGIWIAFPIANVLIAIIALIWFKKGNWKRKKINIEEKLIRKTNEETIIAEGLADH